MLQKKYTKLYYLTPYTSVGIIEKMINIFLISCRYFYNKWPLNWHPGLIELFRKIKVLKTK